MLRVVRMPVTFPLLRGSSLYSCTVTTWMGQGDLLDVHARDAFSSASCRALHVLAQGLVADGAGVVNGRRPH